jgi:uncharacterized membrane protein
MGESIFGKRERLYADARKLEAEKAESSAPAAPPPPAPEPLVPTPPRRPQAPQVSVPVQQKPRPEGFRAAASTALELGGIAMVSVGGFLIAPWVGCIILGILLILLGVAIGYGA